jgi:polyisoprenoid-binding protein YceI
MKRLIPLMTMLTWAGVAAAQPAVELQPGAELAIDGKSTVRDFTCRAREVKAQLTPGNAEGSLALEQLTGALREVQLEIAVAKLDCANATMNEHMLNAMQATQHPTLRFRMSSYEVGAVKDGQVPLRIKGELTMAGTTRPVDLQASGTAGLDGELRVRGRYTLRMTEWGVKPPTLMLGAMKVFDPVVIRFDFTLAQP